MRFFTKSVEKMGRGYSCPILALELYFLIVLAAQNTHAYPRQVDRSGGNDDKFLSTLPKPKLDMNTERSFAQTFEDGQTQNDIESLVEDNNGSNKRVQRHTSKPLGRSFTDSSDEGMQMDGKIVFPGEQIQYQVPSCKGSTYCENVDSYPEHLVNNALLQNESIKYFAGEDVVPEVVQRIDVMDDVPLCASMEQVIYPQTAENKNNQWKFIANQENFKQGVRIEKCLEENTKCSMIGGGAEGYKTSCKQKYVYRQLASISNGTVVPDTFRFPSSCCCHASFTANVYTRMGINLDRERSQVTPIKTRRRK
ncbi:uncharacterized protein LOC143187155 [Calliopsis andreniformis]|uniref:uncharacterized protein LOC143187155 n=1 Tax=Calliopsis andreniformis TaxID=337506 RepID=UPI003FCCDC37